MFEKQMAMATADELSEREIECVSGGGGVEVTDCEVEREGEGGLVYVFFLLDDVI